MGPKRLPPGHLLMSALPLILEQQESFSVVWGVEMLASTQAESGSLAAVPSWVSSLTFWACDNRASEPVRRRW